jgi:[ribosomal protein S5]-alanine N-acetyltransferase
MEDANSIDTKNPTIAGWAFVSTREDHHTKKESLYLLDVRRHATDVSPPYLWLMLLPLAETPRLLLCPYELGDAAFLHPIVSDPVAMSHYPEPFSMERTEAWIKRSLDLYASEGFGRYGLVLKGSGEFIGDVGFFRSVVNGKDEIDLGYIIDRKFWGTGYATEAAQACVDLAKKHRWFDRVVVQMAHENVPSRKVAERLGARLECDFINPRNRDLPTHLFVVDL